MQYLTTAEVAERYRAKESTIRGWRHIGYGPTAVRAGGRTLYPLAELERFDAALLAAAADATTHD